MANNDKQIAFGFRNIKVPKNPTIDSKYGVYSSIQEALEKIPIEQRTIGLTIGVLISNNVVQEYWWQNTIDDSGLIIKYDLNKVLNDANAYTDEASIIKYQIVDSLPEIGVSNIHYLLRDNGLYTEYIWVDSEEEYVQSGASSDGNITVVNNFAFDNNTFMLTTDANHISTVHLKPIVHILTSQKIDVDGKLEVNASEISFNSTFAPIKFKIWGNEIISILEEGGENDSESSIEFYPKHDFSVNVSKNNNQSTLDVYKDSINFAVKLVDSSEDNINFGLYQNRLVVRDNNENEYFIIDNNLNDTEKIVKLSLGDNNFISLYKDNLDCNIELNVSSTRKFNIISESNSVYSQWKIDNSKLELEDYGLTVRALKKFDVVVNDYDESIVLDASSARIVRDNTYIKLEDNSIEFKEINNSYKINISNSNGIELSQGSQTYLKYKDDTINCQGYDSYLEVGDKIKLQVHNDILELTENNIPRINDLINVDNYDGLKELLKIFGPATIPVNHNFNLESIAPSSSSSVLICKFQGETGQDGYTLGELCELTNPQNLVVFKNCSPNDKADYYIFALTYDRTPGQEIYTVNMLIETIGEE